jgi:Stress responsive A/B Barrel Domain
MRLFRLFPVLLATVALTSGSMALTRAQTPAASVRHVVVFKFKPSATPAQIAEVTTAFRGLRTTIPGIVAFEDGVNNSPEKKNLGFTHVYMLTFESLAARDAYLPHPKHKEFGELLGRLGVLEDAFVVDYMVSK